MWMIGYFGDHRHLMAGLHKPARHFVSAGLGGAHFGRKVLGEIENAHGEWSILNSYDG